MTTRITIKDLENICARINRIKNAPLTTYIVNDGKHTAQIGNYHLSQAYSGVSLVCMVNIDGGVRDVLSGHVSKRELQSLMFAYISGLNEVNA